LANRIFVGIRIFPVLMLKRITRRRAVWDSVNENEKDPQPVTAKRLKIKAQTRAAQAGLSSGG
jgi:hypothetical protein